jgi:tRNA dimethylallyltransferase
LTNRIQQRTQQMLAAGWLQEVANLGARYGWELPLLGTLGYRELQAHLQGTCSLAEATELTVVHTRQFAKRQRTWFRAVPEIEWFDTGLERNGSIVLQKVWQRVEEFLIGNSQARST